MSNHPIELTYSENGLSRREQLTRICVNSGAIEVEEGVNPQQIVFVDPREEGSLRLTKKGWICLCHDYAHWACEIPKQLSFRDHVYLVAVSIFPYWIKGQTLTTFDPNLGVLMKMVDGDFGRLVNLLPPPEKK